MLGGLQYGRTAAKGRAWIDQFIGAEGAATFFALIAISIGIVAFGATANNVTVGQKLLRFGIPILFRFPLNKLTLFV